MIITRVSGVGRVAKDSELSGYSVESFAAALKNYISKLSSPLIPFNFYDRFLEVAGKSVFLLVGSAWVHHSSFKHLVKFAETLHRR